MSVWSLRGIAWLGLLVGCSYRPGVGGALDDGSPADGASDGSPTDAAIDSQALPNLTDRGLVIRYFIDEAATGQGPSSLTDSAPSPLALPLTYGQMSFTEIDGHRGLHWPASGGSGKGEISFGSTKLITQLSPAQSVTIEVVAQITAAGGAGSESQIAGLRGGNPDFMLTALGSTDLRFFKPFGSEGATWANANSGQRMVLHLIFDSTRPNPADRIVLYKDGSVVTKSTSTPPGMGQNVGLGSGDELMIGNRQQQDRSLAGTMFYVAYYNVALDANEIGTNTQRLLADDDNL